MQVTGDHGICHTVAEGVLIMESAILDQLSLEVTVKAWSRDGVLELQEVGSRAMISAMTRLCSRQSSS